MTSEAAEPAAVATTVPAAAGLATAADPAATSGTTTAVPAADAAAVTAAQQVSSAPPAPFQPYQNAEGAWIYTDNKLASGNGGPPKGLLSEILQAWAHSRNATAATAPVGGTMVLRSPIDPANQFTPAQLLPLYVGQPGAGGYGSL